MLFLKNKIKVAVHNGNFHADDVFAVAILSLYLKKPLKIFRTRDEKIIKKMDYILDVGRVYNPKENKFDHHQEGWNEKRANGILYATAGLVWKEYGEKITGSLEVANKIETKIIQTIDAEDNGIEICRPLFENIMPFCVSDYLFDLNQSWIENKLNPTKCFEEAVKEAIKILKREIKKATDCVLGKEKIINIYNNTADKKIIVLDNTYSWKKVLNAFPEPLFVIEQIPENKDWHVKAVSLNGFKFKNRMLFPESWAGKNGEEFAKISGVSDAIFCHNQRFMAVTKSEAGAIKLAQLAISEASKSN